jgi:hypothetical protein
MHHKTQTDGDPQHLIPILKSIKDLLISARLPYRVPQGSIAPLAEQSSNRPASPHAYRQPTRQSLPPQ